MSECILSEYLQIIELWDVAFSDLRIESGGELLLILYDDRLYIDQGLYRFREFFSKYLSSSVRLMEGVHFSRYVIKIPKDTTEIVLFKMFSYS